MVLQGSLSTPTCSGQAHEQPGSGNTETFLERADLWQNSGEPGGRRAFWGGDGRGAGLTMWLQEKRNDRKPPCGASPGNRNSMISTEQGWGETPTLRAQNLGGF